MRGGLGLQLLPWHGYRAIVLAAAAAVPRYDTLSSLVGRAILRLHNMYADPHAARWRVSVFKLNKPARSTNSGDPTWSAVAVNNPYPARNNLSRLDYFK